MKQNSVNHQTSSELLLIPSRTTACHARNWDLFLEVFGNGGGGAVFGEGQRARSPPARGLWGALKAPTGVWGKAPVKIVLSTFLSV